MEELGDRDKQPDPTPGKNQENRVMDQSCSRRIGEPRFGEHRNPTEGVIKELRSLQTLAAPLPELESNLGALSIKEPDILCVQADLEIQEKGGDAEFNILMSLACTGGTPRVLSLQSVQQAMARAWKNSYYGLSQLSTYIFVAHFRSLEAAMFVITRQPWSMGSDNFLLEWMDPEDEERRIEDYQFSSIYVTIRVYGVPRRFRSISLLSSILQGLGELSEFHPLHQGMLFARQEYIWGTVKLQINKPVRDKVMVTFTGQLKGIAYLYYERIGRICSFCGIMFHSVQHCPMRNNILVSRRRMHIAVENIAPNKYGEWMTKEELIPQHPNQIGDISISDCSSFQNPQLARLQRQLAENTREKGKGIIQDCQFQEHQKELSITNINEQFARLQDGSTSQQRPMMDQRRMIGSTLQPRNNRQNEGQEQGGAITTVAMNSGNVSQAVNLEEKCNNVGDKQIEVGTDGGHPVRPNPDQRHLGAHHRLYASGEEENILQQRSTTKRPSESILGAPPPPAKKMPPSILGAPVLPTRGSSPAGVGLIGASSVVVG